MTYKRLVDLLYQVGLFITDCKWEQGDIGKVILYGTVSAKTENDTPCFHKGASYSELSGSGYSVDTLAENIWDKMTDKNAKILIGRYGDYHSVIEWSWGNREFVKRKLTEIEAMDCNCPI